MTDTPIEHIGVYTSGGDAPGMNAAIRSVVRTATGKGIEVTGIIQGYKGMIRGDFVTLEPRSVANILQKGGTILKTGRCPEFRQANDRRTAAHNLKTRGIDGLICIGGDGSFQGAHHLYKEHQFPIVGIPGTIDNDIVGTEYTIGFDTAVNTALDAIDRIRDTAASHDRLFIVEVMGRNSGFIATDVGLAGGAEEVFFPDNPVTVDQAIQRIENAIRVGKHSSILVTAEGQKPGRAYDLAEAIRKKAGHESRVCILGHIQRGGAPRALDRIMAARFGAVAVEALVLGGKDIMIGMQANEIVQRPLSPPDGHKRVVPKAKIDLIHVLSI